MIRSGRLRSYWHDIARYNTQKQEWIHFCSGVNPTPYTRYSGSATLYSWGDENDSLGIVFKLEDVEKVEKEFPELFWPTAESLEHDVAGTLEDYDPPLTVDEWVCAATVRKELGFSPADFLNFLNSGAVQTDYEVERREYCQRSGYPLENCPFFDSSYRLDELRIFRRSWEDYKIKSNKHGDVKTALSGKEQEKLGQEANQRIAELESQFETARQRIAELEAQSEDVSQLEQQEGGCRTANAQAAAEEKTAEAYQRDIEMAVTLAVECARDIEAPAKSTNYHQARWKELYKQAGRGDEKSPRKASFAAFRRGLPSDLKEDPPSKK